MAAPCPAGPSPVKRLPTGGLVQTQLADAFSNLFGRRYGKKKLPWHPKKSWAGSTGFVLTAFPAALAFLLYTQHFAPGASLLPEWRENGLAGPLALGGAVVVSLAGALVAAFVESLPVRIDDNLTVTFSSGAAMAACLAFLV